MSEFEQRMKTCERVTKTGLAVPFDFLGHQLGNAKCDWCDGYDDYRSNENQCIRCLVGIYHYNFEDSYHHDYWCDYCGLIAHQTDWYDGIDQDICSECGHTREWHFTEYDRTEWYDNGCVAEIEDYLEDQWRCGCKNYRWEGLNNLEVKDTRNNKH